jgi:hypothetical protein
MFWPQRRLLADELAFVPGLSLRRRGHRLCLNLHGHPPGLVRHDQDAEPACFNEQPTSVFDALPLCGPEVRARWTRLTQSGNFDVSMAPRKRLLRRQFLSRPTEMGFDEPQLLVHRPRDLGEHVGCAPIAPSGCSRLCPRAPPYRTGPTPTPQTPISVFRRDR